MIEYVKIAIRSILASKGRSFLTMLGIIIGISSVITVITIGNSVSDSVSGELDTFGGGMINIYIDYSADHEDVEFDDDDIAYLMSHVEHIKGATSNEFNFGTANGPKGTFDATATSGNTALQYYNANKLLRGRYFSDADYEAGNRVCVITRASAITLFGTDDVVGLTFEFALAGQTMELKVIGIREDNQAQFISLSIDGFVSIEMPQTVINNALGAPGEYTDLLIFPDSNLNATEVAEKSLRLLRNRKQVADPDTIRIQSMTEITEEINSVMGYVTLFVSLVAAISLLVGGIGVMNIMLVSVTERTREIGIRKALGARTGTILLQFLAEAGIITLLGGLIGIALGISLSYLICSFLPFEAHPRISVILIATLFSSGVGIFFGIYPARKAAKLSPIEALRHD